MNICRRLISGRVTRFSYLSRYSSHAYSSVPPTSLYGAISATSVPTSLYGAISATSVPTLADLHFQKEVAAYTWILRTYPSYGLPQKWTDAVYCFDTYHAESIRKIQSRYNTINTLISKESYMQLYLKCTFMDLEGVFSYFPSKGIAVGSIPATYITSGYTTQRPDMHFIRVSPLVISHIPSMMLRVDASLVGNDGGYGFIFTEADGDFLEWGLGSCDNVGIGLDMNDRVTVLELLAIHKALSNPVFAKAAAGDPRLRIMSDSLNAVQILHGKPVLTRTVNDVTRIHLNLVMDVLCLIGFQIKALLLEYSASHIYREINGSCDFLAGMGRRLKLPTDQEVLDHGRFDRIRPYN